MILNRTSGIITKMTMLEAYQAAATSSFPSLSVRTNLRCHMKLLRNLVMMMVMMMVMMTMILMMMMIMVMMMRMKVMSHKAITQSAVHDHDGQNLDWIWW